MHLFSLLLKWFQFHPGVGRGWMVFIVSFKPSYHNLGKYFQKKKLRKCWFSVFRPYMRLAEMYLRGNVWCDLCDGGQNLPLWLE